MSNTTGSLQLQQLLDSFRSSLDDSLVVAIAGDYDLATETGYEGARSTLNSLAQHAAIEEASSLDPEGVIRYTENGDPSLTHDTTPTSGCSQDIDEAEDVRSDHGGMAARVLLNNNGTAGGEVTTDELLESDVVQLQALFPEIKSLDIRQALVDANGVVAVALDTLLSIQYLQATRQQPASSEFLLDIDRLGAQAVCSTGHIGEYDKQKNENSSVDAKAARTPAGVSYIAERLHMSAEEVSIILSRVRRRRQ
ncbi:hypothetical protein TgHK011_002929 [Trichoderma gracile]|nr:hypothetical protein TgHK011_002929 [Trichoderma gracile]